MEAESTLASVLCADRRIDQCDKAFIGQLCLERGILEFEDICAVLCGPGLEIDGVGDIVHEGAEGLRVEIYDHLLILGDDQGMRVNLLGVLIPHG